MATSVKSLEGMAPNAIDRVEGTREKGLCQKCFTKTGTQYNVSNDLDAGTVKVKKAGKTGNHYCGECKDVRVKMKQSWLDNRDGEAKPKKKAKGKKAAPKKAAGKKKAAPKKTAAKKSTSKKGGRGKKATADEPF